MQKKSFFIFRIPIAFKCKWLAFANKIVRSEGRNGEEEEKSLRDLIKGGNEVTSDIVVFSVDLAKRISIHR